MSIEVSGAETVQDEFDPNSFELLPQEQDQLDELQKAAKDAEHAVQLRRLFVTNLATRLNLI